MDDSTNTSSSMALWSVGGLLAGLVLGVGGAAAELDWVPRLATLLNPVGTLWMNALRMTVVPLVLTQTLAALVRPGRRTSSLGRLGLRSVALFSALILCTGLISTAVVPEILDLYHPPLEVKAAFQTPAAPGTVGDLAVGGGFSLQDWLVGLMPVNLFEAAVQGEILQLLLVSILLGAAVNRLPEDRREPLAHLFRSLAQTVLILIGWILLATPVGVFTLVLGLSVEAGFGLLGALGSFVAGVSGLTLLFILLLYPVTLLLGRVSFRRFSRAVAPAQVVAVGTQSSLACLPALVEGADHHLELEEEYTGFVLPLAASTFRLSQGILPIYKLLFVASVLDLTFSGPELAVFLGWAMVGSFSVPGISRGGGMTSLPLYLAFGVPIEAVVLLEAVETIPDIFLTLLNVTSDMSIATILSRDRRIPPALS